MKVLVYAPTSQCDPHFGMQLEEAESFFRAGDTVYFAFCDGSQRYCFKNPQGNQLFCKFCRFCAKKWIKKNLSAGVKIVPMKNQVISSKTEWKYDTVRDIKNISWRDVAIGYGVMASFVTATRNPEPDLKLPEVRKYFDFALDHAAALTDQFYDLVDRIAPDVISVFNGRFMEQRPLYDIAKKRNISLRVNESIGGSRTESNPQRIIFHDHLPHSIPYNTELIHKLWDISDKSAEEKERKGRAFFEFRRHGIPAGDRVYIGKQQKGLLPDDWNEKKRNIVIFNSSEDEFSSVGKDFEDYALFNSQFEGINSILSHFSSAEYHFYLRVHPNLAKVAFPYHTALYDLPGKYKNLTVISATAPCSTYDLLDAAEKVIVFGSTMGVEAVFWGKPTLLLAGAFYYNLDLCYTPENEEELYQLIENRDLPPKGIEGAIKYGYFILDNSLLTIPARYVDYTLYKTGKKSCACGYAAIFGSRNLVKLIRKLLRRFYKKRKGLLPEKTF